MTTLPVPDRTRTEALICVGAFAFVTLLVVALDQATLSPGETLTREGGGIETMSMLGYLVGIAIYLWKGPRPPFWAVPATLLFMALRESDADKRFTSEGILSTKILIYDTPIWEKVLALGVWAALAVTLVMLMRRRGPDLLVGLRRGVPWALWAASGILLAAFSKSIDGLARKLVPWGIEVPQGVSRGAGTVEELSELLVPVCFMVAMFLCIPRTGDGESFW